MVTSGELGVGWQGHQPLNDGLHHWRGQGWAPGEPHCQRRGACGDEDRSAWAGAAVLGGPGQGVRWAPPPQQDKRGCRGPEKEGAEQATCPGGRAARMDSLELWLQKKALQQAARGNVGPGGNSGGMGGNSRMGRGHEPARGVGWWAQQARAGCWSRWAGRR